ncbi:laminin subunit alpha-4-like [Mercenaria mercenaria]|uniref:laminin subunit alpha-4-like n=1 Tax=Mercenaria mercenaria TaxID=6596 RepID=UPI001E1D602F|nr:laminin subunit alpha-4-like [Mercenaria mercenaria]
MDSLRLSTIFVGIFSLVTGASAGACYQFSGTGSVSFVENIPSSGESAHFKLKFKTIADSGILYYAEGQYHPERVYDFEGVFMRDGYLHYFLFNPGEFSIGSSFGFHGKSKKKVNDGNWHEVEFYRNIQMETIRENGKKERVYQTGLKLDGRLQASDDRWRDGVNIDKPVILGEDPHLQDRSSKSIGNFKGKIKDFEDLTNDKRFNAEHEQLAAGVSHCIAAPDAV